MYLRLRNAAGKIQRLTITIISDIITYPAIYLISYFRLSGFIFRNRETVIVNSFPRSSSSFTTDLLKDIFKLKRVFLIYRNGSSEQDLFEPEIIRNIPYNTIAQHHFKATGSNIHLISRYNVKVIILVRNIFDTIVSIREAVINFISKYEGKKELYENGIMPIFYCNEKFIKMTEKEQYDLIVDHAVPWLIQFYVSWTEIYKKGNISLKFVNYSEITAATENKILEISDFLKIRPANSLNETIIQHSRNPRNAGAKSGSGRGKKILSSEQIERVICIAKRYTDYDFSEIGIF